MNGKPDNPGAVLAAFAAGLRYEDIPGDVLRRAEDLLLDWLGSALAGKSSPQVEAFERFAREMGPASGPCELLTNRARTSAWFAALVHGAASHVVEQDDLHNRSVLHPACVVFPPVLALAQERGLSGRQLLTAAVAGYETGARVGEFLGRSHYSVFHTTGTAGTLAAAAAAGTAMQLNPGQMLHAFGSAGTQAAGLWEFLREGADSKQLHTAKAAANGLMSAQLAQSGFTGAARIFDGQQGMAAGMSRAPDVAALTDQLGSRWAVTETSFKFHASCRHTHPAADALLQLMQEHGVKHGEIRKVTARVHQAALDVLGPVTDPQSVHQAKFSMGTVLALIALYGRADVRLFETCLEDPRVAAFRSKVSMVLDEAVDQAYPGRWLGRVEVELDDGRKLAGATDVPYGDPANTLGRPVLEDKFRTLAAFRGAATEAEAERLIDWVWSLADCPRVGVLLPQ
jgi:2-methylcitrate dehydratase PrpD